MVNSGCHTCHNQNENYFSDNKTLINTGKKFLLNIARLAGCRSVCIGYTDNQKKGNFVSETCEIYEEINENESDIYLNCANLHNLLTKALKERKPLTFHHSRDKCSLIVPFFFGKKSTGGAFVLADFSKSQEQTLLEICKVVAAILGLFAKYSETKEKYRNLNRLLFGQAKERKPVLFSLNLKKKRFDYISPSVKQLLGIETSALETKPLMFLKKLNKAERKKITDSIRFFKKNRGFFQKILLLKWKKGEGENIWVEMMLSPEYRKGELLRIQGVARGIQEKRQHYALNDKVLSREVSGEASEANIDKKLLNYHRLHSLSYLAAGMIHEIKQPLNSAKILAGGLIYLLKGSYEIKTNKLTEKLDEIMKQIERIDLIVERMRSFIRQGRIHVIDQCKINDAVKEAAEILDAQFRAYGIALKLDLEENIPCIIANKFELEEIIINLLVNAIEAFEKTRKKEKMVIVKTYLIEGKVVVEITDNATGIEEEEIGKIFEPFFTTKDACGGRGMGLFFVQNLAREYRGEVSVNNNDLGGATFRIEFLQQKGVN